MQKLAWCTLLVFICAACGTGGDQTQNKKEDDSTTNAINGKLLDACGAGRPVSNARVIVPGKTAVLTDAQGQFRIDGIGSTYDITVIPAGSKTSRTYRGVGSRTPVLHLRDDVNKYSTTYIGRLSGGTGFPMPKIAGKENMGKALFSNNHFFTVTDFDTSEGSMTSSAFYWCDTAQTTISLYGLQYRTNTQTGAITEYTGFGSRAGVVLEDRTLLNESDDPTKQLNMLDVPEGKISGKTTVATGYVLAGTQLLFAADATAYAPLEKTSVEDFSFVSADALGAKHHVIATALSPAIPEPADQMTVISVKANVGPNVSGMVLNLPAAANLNSPNKNATGITSGTEFSWTKLEVPDGAVYTVFVLPLDPEQPSFQIVTTNLSSVIPDLSAQGLGLNPAQRYAWQVSATSGIANMDQVVGEQIFPDDLNNLKASAFTRDLMMSWSAQQNFTIK
jgi:hypothetical protein